MEGVGAGVEEEPEPEPPAGVVVDMVGCTGVD